MKWGIINMEGLAVVPCMYDVVGAYHEGLCKVGLNGKYGYIDNDGREIISCQYEDCGDFSEGLA